MGLFDMFRKSDDIETIKFRLAGFKKVKINGVRFVIRKLNPTDHLAGLKILLSYHDLYKKQKDHKVDKISRLEDLQKMEKFFRDFIYAGVVSPKISMIADKTQLAPDEIHVDDILSNLDTTRKLASAIIGHTYKKKLTTV